MESSQFSQSSQYVSTNDLTDPIISQIFVPNLSHSGVFMSSNGIRPNAITLGRLVLILPAIYAMRKTWNGPPKIIIAYIVAAAIMLNQYLDCVDGFVARKYSQTSQAGKYLDIGVDLILLAGITAALHTKLKIGILPSAVTMAVLYGGSKALNKVALKHSPNLSPLLLFTSPYIFQTLLTFGITSV